jgi:hypothetical protein
MKDKQTELALLQSEVARLHEGEIQAELEKLAAFEYETLLTRLKEMKKYFQKRYEQILDNVESNDVSKVLKDLEYIEDLFVDEILFP